MCHARDLLAFCAVPRIYWRTGRQLQQRRRLAALVVGVLVVQQRRRLAALVVCSCDSRHRLCDHTLPPGFVIVVLMACCGNNK